MNELFSIGEISKLFHIDVRLLRHYDKISLRKPEFVDKKTDIVVIPHVNLSV